MIDELFFYVKRGFWGILYVCGFVSPAVSQTYNAYGVPGHIEMPNAYAAPDAELAFTITHHETVLKSTLAFQITPKFSGAFRYGSIANYFSDGTTLFDRSFDLRYQFLSETPNRPALAVGLQDIIGTGVYSGEYIAASKTLGNRLNVTAGLGWGRFGGYNSIGSFGTRQTGFTGTGGQVELGKWFRGPLAPFGAVSWRASERLSFDLEYSSDDKSLEVVRGHLTHKTPLNASVKYNFGAHNQISLYALHGSTVGFYWTLGMNPKQSPVGNTRDAAPLPVKPRSPGSMQNLGWAVNADSLADTVRTQLGPIFLQDGLVLEGLTLQADRAVLRIQNKRYAAQTQAVGHAARILATVLPASVEQFDIVLMVKGTPMSQIKLNRTDIERFEHHSDAANMIAQVAAVEDAAAIDRRQDRLVPSTPLAWSFGPYLQGSLFDPDSPLRVDVGVQLKAEWSPAPGVFVNGLLRQTALGNLDGSKRFSDSVLPHVRSDSSFYAKTDGPVLKRLTAAYFFRPSQNTYGRITAGYLERQYGGVSTELLWKPTQSRWAVGIEANYAKQRSWEGLGFKPMTVISTNPVTDAGYVGPEREYDVFTGHVSLYYELGKDFHMQLDVGQYLAGDKGATFSLDREFQNGWKVGAYATLTDVSFDDFGEGSFDKGIRLSIPFDWQLGTPSRKSSEILIQPVLRDGGARLHVEDRLYGLVRDTHKPVLDDRWARFWR